MKNIEISARLGLFMAIAALAMPFLTTASDVRGGSIGGCDTQRINDIALCTPKNNTATCNGNKKQCVCRGDTATFKCGEETTSNPCPGAATCAAGQKDAKQSGESCIEVKCPGGKAE